MYPHCVYSVYTVRIHREIHFLLGIPLLKIVISPDPDGVGRPYGTLRVGKFAILANGTVSGRIGIEPETCEQKIRFSPQFFHLSAPNFVNLLYSSLFSATPYTYMIMDWDLKNKTDFYVLVGSQGRSARIALKLSRVEVTGQIRVRSWEHFSRGKRNFRAF